ncbi:MAG: hypothetical protein F4X02_02095 [Chloroflexi bacterium]|nr:hypothetical protein [Chloroflexota bacterium]
MSSLFDKIATLVNAQVNELLGKNPSSPLARIRLDADDAEKRPRDSAQALRRRLDEAFDYEEILQAKIDALMAEAAELDAQIDASVRQGDEFGARRLQGQLNSKQQQLTIAESELRDHRALSRHLLQEMGNLEAALDERDRQRQSQPSANQQTQRRTRIPVDGAGLRARGYQSLARAVTNKLDEARDGLESLINRERPPTRTPSRPAPPSSRFIVVDEEPDPRQPKARKKDAGDMNRRLSRLSKPQDDE